MRAKLTRHNGPLSVRACAKLVPMHHSTLAQHIKNGAVRSHHGGRVVYLQEVMEDLANNIDLTRSHSRGAKGRRAGEPGPSPAKGALQRRKIERPLQATTGFKFEAESDLEHWADLVDSALRSGAEVVTPAGFGRNLLRTDALVLLDELRRGPGNVDRIFECLLRLGIEELPVVRVRMSEVLEDMAATGFRT
jgi:hypothetical protein